MRTTNTIYDYDIIVIGAGPGGYETAIKAAQLGKKTAIVEEKHFGGICLNEGCIPTKTLIHSANLFTEVKEAGEFAIEGISEKAISISMEKLQKRRRSVINTLVSGVEGLLKRNKVALINGHGHLRDSHTVEVSGKSYSATNLIIATGSSVFMPPFIAQEGKNNILTSKEALEIEKLPKKLAIIGGGVIGIEFAHIFSQLGVEVVVLELMANILPMVDAEISDMVKTRMEKKKVQFINGAKVSKIKDNAVMYELSGKEETVKCDAVLMAVGRVANTDGLGAEGIGIEFDKKNIKTNEFLQTNIPNIYAIGDVNGKLMLAHTASHEGFVAVAHIAGGHHPMSYDKIPSCIYTKPEIASIGLTEAQAKEKGLKIKVGRFPMMANGKSLVGGDTDGLVKVIIEESLGEILGVHLYGSYVTDMIGEIAVAMQLEATAEEILEAIHPHPTVSEAIAEGFMSAHFGKAINC